jgi:putative sigma-54 modulation protein
MKLIITTHNIDLTGAIENYVRDRLEKLDHYDPQIIDARVILEHDHARIPKKQFKCAVRLSIPGRDLFAEDTESDLYKAIDKVAKKIEQQIRTRHNKRLAKKQRAASIGKRILREEGI